MKRWILAAALMARAASGLAAGAEPGAAAAAASADLPQQELAPGGVALVKLDRLRPWRPS